MRLTSSVICAILSVAPLTSAAAADSFKAPALSGTVYAYLGYDLSNYDDANQEGASAFDVPRIYVNVKGAVTEKLYYRVTADVGRESYTYYTYEPEFDPETGEIIGLIETEHTKTGRLDFYAKYAYVDVRDVIPDHSIYGGIEKTPWIGNEEEIWGWRVIRKVVLDDRKWDSSADLGLGVGGEFGNGMVAHHLTVTNGAGYGNPEDGLSGKAVAYRLSVYPLPSNESFKGLSVNAYVKADNLGEKVAAGEDKNPVTMYGGLLGLRHEFVNFGAGYFMRSAGEGDNKVDGNVVTAYATAHFRATEGMTVHPLVRYDAYEPDADTSDDERTLIIGGVGMKFFDGALALIPNYQTESYKEVDPVSGATTDRSTDYVYLHCQWDWE